MTQQGIHYRYEDIQMEIDEEAEDEDGMGERVSETLNVKVFEEDDEISCKKPAAVVPFDSPSPSSVQLDADVDEDNNEKDVGSIIAGPGRDENSDAHRDDSQSSVSLSTSTSPDDVCPVIFHPPASESPTPRVSHTTGYVVAQISPELMNEDPSTSTRWIDSKHPYYGPLSLVPKAPTQTCTCAIPWRSMKHLWDCHVQPLDCARNITFEGHHYPSWVGQFYPNGEPKSVLRGVSHEFAFVAVIIYACFLFPFISSTPGFIAAAVCVATQLLLYGVSSQFHRRIWRPRIFDLLKRADHSGIFLLASGSATPSAVLMICNMDGHYFVSTAGWIFLGWSWGGALLGVLYSWTKSLSGRVSVFGLVWMGVVGACMVPFVYVCYLVMTQMEFALTLVAWFIYLLALLVYSRQLGDFWPSVFGYHEVFHILTIMGGIAASAFNFSICTRLEY